MDNQIIKKILPHIGAYAIFMLVSFIFFKPLVFDGKTLSQSDDYKAKGMAAEISKIKKETGVAPQWTNAAFGGMPTHQIHLTTKGNYGKHIFYGLYLWQGPSNIPFVILFAMFSCYLLFIGLKMDWRIAIFGSICYGIAGNHMDLAEAGHLTKLVAFSILPLVYLGPILAFRGKYLLGGGIFALATCLHLYPNHIQITFYAYLTLCILGIIELIKAIRNQTLPNFGKAAGILVIGLLLGILPSTSKLWSTYEFAAESTRGKSELKAKAAKGDGLDKDYLWGWSYGIGETMTLLVPQYMGGGAAQSYEKTKTYDRLVQAFKQQGMSSAQAKSTANQQAGMLMYTGDQPFVGMGIYFGAIICFLFAFGGFLVKGEMKIWLLLAALFAIMISWGGNFFLNHFLVDYVPMFNKFRAVSMALGLAQLAFILLAMLGLQKLVDKEVSAEAKQKALMYAFGIVGGVCLLAFLASYGMDLSGKNDSKAGPDLTRLLKEDRASMLRTDAIRSLIFIALAAGLMWAYLQGKVKGLFTVLGVGLLMVIDIWSFDARYMRSEKFEDKKELDQQQQSPRPVDLEIQKDSDLHYRVLDLSNGNFSTDSYASYFHKSMGGYHAAKLIRYQELFERYFSNPGKNMHVFGMYNTKYIIQGEGNNASASRNPSALGNAWFVNNYEIVADGDAEINALANLNPENKAVVQKAESAPLSGLNIVPDSMAYIKLTSYHPDKMVYEYSNANEGLAVFSEMYYPPEKGWSVYLDGQPYDPFMKANFALRACRLPAGKHELEMRFEPRSFYLGETISVVGSILMLLLFFGGLFLYFKNNGLPELESISDVEVKEKKTPVKKTVSKSKKGKKKK